MNRHRTLVMGFFALVVVTCCAIVAIGDLGGQEHVYSVAAARATLMRAPELWAGRTMSVYGRLDSCPVIPAPCPIRQPRLFDPSQGSGHGALPVEVLPSGSWLAAAHSIPVLGAIVPAPGAVHWGRVATYQIHVQAVPLTQCFTYLCYLSGGNTDYDAFTCDTRACYNATVSAGSS